MESRIFVTCPRGLEEVTSEELSLLLNKKNTINPGGVHLDGDILDTYKINLASRTAMHVLQEIMSVRSNNLNELYTLIKSYK